MVGRGGGRECHSEEATGLDRLLCLLTIGMTLGRLEYSFDSIDYFSRDDDAKREGEKRGRGAPLFLADVTPCNAALRALSAAALFSSSKRRRAALSTSESPFDMPLLPFPSPLLPFRWPLFPSTAAWPLVGGLVGGVLRQQLSSAKESRRQEGRSRLPTDLMASKSSLPPFPTPTPAPPPLWDTPATMLVMVKVASARWAIFSCHETAARG